MSMQKAIYEATQDFYESILAAETLVGRKETVKILVDNGMSVKEIKRFFSNRFRGQDISLASLKKMSQEIDFGGDAASKKKTMEALFDLEERFSRTPIFPPAPEKGIGRIKKSKGGTVEIPNAPEEPDERIDKVTGLPYNLQAGKAFVDVEDRKGFAGGGMTRPDGTKKSSVGWLGPITNNVSGGTMTEYSTDMDYQGKSINIPTLVPTLSESEIKHIKNMKPGEGWNLSNPLEKAIINKARAWAQEKLKAGKSPYYQDNE
jgi:hypothetical protein